MKVFFLLLFTYSDIYDALFLKKLAPGSVVAQKIQILRVVRIESIRWVFKGTVYLQDKLTRPDLGKDFSSMFFWLMLNVSDCCLPLPICKALC